MAGKYDKFLDAYRESDTTDLSDYYTESEVNTLLSGYIPTSDYDDFVNVGGDTMTGDLNMSGASTQLLFPDATTIAGGILLGGDTSIFRPSAGIVAFQTNVADGDTIFKVESDDTGDRADFQLVGHNSSNNGDQFLFSFRTDLADVTISAYDASSTTFFQLVEFDYLDRLSKWGENTNLHTSGSYNAPSDANLIVLQHRDSSNNATLPTTGIVFEIDADDWDGAPDKYARIFAQRTSDWAGTIDLVFSSWDGSLEEHLRVNTGGIDVTGLTRTDSFRIDQAPAAGTITPTHTITINVNGTDYKIPIVAA